MVYPIGKVKFPGDVLPGIINLGQVPGPFLALQQPNHHLHWVGRGRVGL